MKNKPFTSAALIKIYRLIDEIKGDEESVDKGVKTAIRRSRVALSNISKLCKEARSELLAKAKE